MLNSIQIDILNYLLEHPGFVTSKQLSDYFKMSSKTILNHVHLINDSLMAFNYAHILFSPNKGMRLEINDIDKTNALISSFESMNRLPQTQEERIRFIAKSLLFNKSIYNHKIADQLFISLSTFNSDLRKLKLSLRAMNLDIVSTKNHGIKLIGDENDIRKFYVSLIEPIDFKDNDNLFTIKEKILIPLFINKKINISDILLNTLAIHLFIAIQRVTNNYSIDFKYDNSKSMLISINDELNELLQQYFGIKLPNSELAYLNMHILGKQELNRDSLQLSINLDDHEEQILNRQINNILRRIFKVKGIDLFRDSELKANLLLHLLPFRQRAEYGMFIKNPILSTIKEQYPFSHELAVIGLQAIKDNYSCKIPDDEIGYFALHFILALERQKINQPKSNIIIVCSTGKTSSELLAMQVRNAFSDHINTIFVSEAYKLSSKSIELESYDFILTTVPLEMDEINIPVYRINTILTDKDYQSIKNIFDSKQNQSILNIISPDLFFTDIIANNREDALKQLIQLVSKHILLSDNFYSSVMARESFSPTDIKDYIAIPHPNEEQTNRTFVAIGILEKPILWSSKNVQMIFLISPSSADGIRLKPFYNWLTQFLTDDEKIANVIHKKSFNEIVKTIKFS